MRLRREKLLISVLLRGCAIKEDKGNSVVCIKTARSTEGRYVGAKVRLGPRRDLDSLDESQQPSYYLCCRRKTGSLGAGKCKQLAVIK